jgi:type II restriction enzyme
MAAFARGSDEVLWNAKPRFGKTLTTYHLMRELDAVRVLVVTNRPAIANSWFDDFTRFIGHQTTFKFVSESPSLARRSPMTRAQWIAYSNEHMDKDPRVVEFLSLQDLKGSQYFGGTHKKLKHIADFHWDLLVIDEAHEGVDTTKTDIAFDQIKRKHTLHLSGTPFKALASGRFTDAEIFNWTYEDEQQARADWDDGTQENPYAALPTLNLLTYQLSRMITDRLAEGVAIDEDEASVDFTFDLNQFFATKDNGFFEYEAEVIKFLDTLTTNDKYPFSTPDLRDEIRHSFWLLHRVASAKALEKLLKAHPVFRDYTVVLAAGDGRTDEDDPVAIGKSLDKVRGAIASAEASGGKTITLSVGQLTTGVTVPEWTAVIMLSNMASPAQYMQAAFRAQNPHTFMRADQVLQKQNAYIFDFAPERTLTIFDDFANNLSPKPPSSAQVRQDNIRTLLNFFPVLGEDSRGAHDRARRLPGAHLPADLQGPRGRPSRVPVEPAVRERRRHLPLLRAREGDPGETADAKQGKVKKGETLDIPQPPPTTDRDGNVQVDETVINPKVAELGPPVWSVEDIPAIDPATPAAKAATEIARFVTSQTGTKREELKDAYQLTNKQVERDVKRTEQQVADKVERALTDHQITQKHLQDEFDAAATEAEAEDVKSRQASEMEAFKKDLAAIVEDVMATIVPEVVKREETKSEQKRADKTMEDARSHLRGFARTIPMFLMAYGDRDTRLANFDDYTPDDVFEEITGITEAEFRVLRDGQRSPKTTGRSRSSPACSTSPSSTRPSRSSWTRKRVWLTTSTTN